MRIIGRGVAITLVIVATVVIASGCAQQTDPGTMAPSEQSAAAPEDNPAGDIPDNQTYVPFNSPDGLVTVTIPEGWSSSVSGDETVFTDKLDTVRVRSAARPDPPTVDSVTAQELPALAAAPGYRLGAVTDVQRRAGPAVEVTYEATSAPNPVTGKTVAEAVERYTFWRSGHEVTVTLSGPVGADNVDSWRTITDSVQWHP